MRRPILLGKEYFPSQYYGDKDLTYFKNRLKEGSQNLKYLVEKRYSWMKDVVSPQESGLEIGAGIGASKLILTDYNYVMTDVYKHDWIDQVEDGMNLSLSNESLDYIIASNVIHHMAFPIKFFREAHRVLKPNGKILINDVRNSLLMRIMLKSLSHEGYSYDRNVFSEHIAVNDPKDPWSGNDAVADILFENKALFLTKTGFRIEHDQACECLIFLLSGGISSEFFTIPLPRLALNVIDKVDVLLSLVNPIFPLSRKTILVKAS